MWRGGPLNGASNRESRRAGVTFLAPPRSAPRRGQSGGPLSACSPQAPSEEFVQQGHIFTQPNNKVASPLLSHDRYAPLGATNVSKPLLQTPVTLRSATQRCGGGSAPAK